MQRPTHLIVGEMGSRQSEVDATESAAEVDTTTNEPEFKTPGAVLKQIIGWHLGALRTTAIIVTPWVLFWDLWRRTPSETLDCQVSMAFLAYCNLCIGYQTYLLLREFGEIYSAALDRFEAGVRDLGTDDD